jgi:hypothetical protein
LLGLPCDEQLHGNDGWVMEAVGEGNIAKLKTYEVDRQIKEETHRGSRRTVVAEPRMR